MIKFRIWNNQANQFVENSSSLHCQSNCMIDPFTGEVNDFVNAHGGGDEYTRNNEQKYLNFDTQSAQNKYIIEQFTGLLDINSKEIYEGDILVVYPENYKSTLINTGSMVEGLPILPIYEVDTSKPLPLKDIVLFKGIVEYSAPKFDIKVLNSKKIGRIRLEDYWFEVIGNKHENPELTK